MNKIYVVEVDVGHDEYMVVSAHKTSEGASQELEKYDGFKMVRELELKE